MNRQPVNVTAVFDAEIESHRNSLPEFQAELDNTIAARAAFVELWTASDRAIRAFEAYGRARKLVCGARRRQECEAAMVSLKAAVSDITGMQA